VIIDFKKGKTMDLLNHIANSKMKYLSKIFKNRLAISFFVISSAIIPLNHANAAVTYTWTATPTGNWNAAGNWTPAGGPPTSADTANINIVASVTVDSSDTASILNVSGPAGDILNINSGGTLTIGSSASLGAGVGTQGTININSATASLVLLGGSSLQVGIAGTGVLNITAGASLTSPGSTLLGSGPGGSGTLLVDGVGSTFNASLLEIGAQNGATGTVTIQNGGKISDTILLAIGTSTGTINLFDGAGGSGILNTAQITAGATGNSTLNFNGGTIQANSNNTNFISGVTNAQIFNGGAIFDTQTFNVTVPQNFVNGAANSGSITKIGSGTLILTGTNTLSGTTTISNGILQANVPALPTGAVSITGNGTLVFDQAITATFASNISGNGNGIVKQNVGTLILTGNNSYTGFTVISAGILQGNTTSLPSTAGIFNSATVVFDQSFNGTYSSNILGTGQLVKENAGILTLTGLNSYGGGTVIVGGALQGNTTSIPSAGGIFVNTEVIFDQAFTDTYSGAINGSGILTKQNAGTLILTGANTYSGGTFILGGALQGNTNSIPGGFVTDNASLIFDQGFNGTFLGNIAGTGSLTKQNIGTLILGATNLYTGGTNILAGTLQGDINSIPSGPVLDNASLVFDQGFDGTFSGNISGSGSLTKQNIGALTLTGLNSYAAGTFVNAGTLIGDSNSISSGPVVDNASLIFNQNFDGTFAGSISGAGTLLKSGTGKLQMTGNSGAFLGSTTIASGNLNVNGVLGGNTTVNAGGILSGTGFLGNVVNNGTIKPGNSIGTIHVVNFVNGPTGIYQAEINGSGASTQIAASGSATLNRGELVVTADPGIYMAGTTFTLINTGAGLTGTFSSVLLPTNVPTVLTYLPASLILTVTRTTLNVAGLSGNAQRTAIYIRDHMDADPDFLTVIGALNTLDLAQLQSAFNQLHPALFEALALTVGDTTHMINSTFTDRLDYLRRTSCCNPCDPCACQGMSTWSAGVADFIRQQRTEGLRRFTTSNKGLAFGFDSRLDNSLLAGVGAGYSQTSLQWGNSAGHAYIDGYYLGAYATKFDDRYYIDGSILGFVNQHHVRRHIHFATIDRRAKNRHYSYGFNPHLGAGVSLNYCTVDVIPFFDIDYYLVQQNRVREHGAESLNLHVKRNQTNLLRLETGVRFTKCYEFGCGSLLPNASISYVAHRVLSGKRYISAFEGIDATFSVFGTKRVFNQLELGGGLLYIIDDSLAVNTWYDVELGHKRQEQEVNVEINYRF
jgi:fibronectin-binding autotransporter adhesin